MMPSAAQKRGGQVVICRLRVAPAGQTILRDGSGDGQ